MIIIVIPILRNPRPSVLPSSTYWYGSVMKTSIELLLNLSFLQQGYESILEIIIMVL